MKFDTSKLSETERKTYQTGMEIVRRKLAGHHKPTAQEISARSMQDGQRIVDRKLLSARIPQIADAAVERVLRQYEANPRAFLAKPAAKPVMAAPSPQKAAPSITRKSFEKPTLHRYACGSLF